MTATRNYTALLLAGSRGPSDPVALAGGQKWKVLVPVAGRPMLERVLATLMATPPISRIYISHNQPDDLKSLPWLAPLLADGGRVTLLQGGDGPAASVAKALADIDTPLPLLITTADHPLLSPQIIRYFTQEAPSDCDLAVGLGWTDEVTKAYPQAVRTRFRLTDGAIGGCNLFLLKTAQSSSVVDLWRRLEQHRKAPVKMIREAGIGLLIRFILRRLSLSHILRALKSKTGATIAPVMLPFPEASIDVDKPEDLALVEKILSQPRL